MTSARAVNAQYLGEDEPPVIRVTGKAARPAGWPLTYIGIPAAVALLYGSGAIRKAGAGALAFLAYLWITGRWPPEGTTPDSFFGGGQFAPGSGAGR